MKYIRLETHRPKHIGVGLVIDRGRGHLEVCICLVRFNVVVVPRGVHR